MTNEDVTISFSDGILNISVTAPETVEDENGGDWVLHFAAPPLGVWPSEVSVFWNDTPVLCDKMTSEN